MNRGAYLAAVAASAAALSAAHGAYAQTACDSLPNPVYVSGSTAIKPLLAAIGPLLADASRGADRLTIVYKGTGSCQGVTDISANNVLTGNATNYTTTAGANCTLPATATTDMALSDVFMTSCDGVDTSQLNQAQALVIPFSFLVPHASTQVAIDVREAYLAYGFGAAGDARPWINESFMFKRDALSGTQITIAKNALLPNNLPFGSNSYMNTSGMTITIAGTGDMLNALRSVTSGDTAEATIGFAGMDSADAARDTITHLAYRHWGQNNFYWADSTANGFDKANVRDGHYPLWSYEQAIVRNGGGAAGRLLQSILSGAHTVAGVDTVALTTHANLVPVCAMGVSRTTDGGDFSVYAPTEPCACYFENNAGPAGTTHTSACTACTDNSMCGAGQQCRRGYCEAR